MRRSSLYIIGLLFFLLAGGGFYAPAQRHKGGGPRGAPAPSIRATVDKQKIFIGEPIQLMLEVTVFDSSSLSWPALDSIPHFEWLQKGSIDSSKQAGGRYYRQYLTVTSFDSGSWVIPSMPFLTGNKKYGSDSVRIEVNYTKIDPNKDYHDIKEIIDVSNPFARWFGWMVAIVAIGSLVLVVWLVRRRHVLKGKVYRREEVRLSPYEEAMRQLDELQKRYGKGGVATLPVAGGVDLPVESGVDRPAEEPVKLYYSRLGDIFRIYLSRRLGIASLAETSDEIIGQLRKRSLPADRYNEITETLRMSDFVKFAKYQPGISDSEYHYQVIRSVIGQLEEERRAQETAAADKEAAVTKDGVTPRDGASDKQTNK